MEGGREGGERETDRQTEIERGERDTDRQILLNLAVHVPRQKSANIWRQRKVPDAVPAIF